METLILVKASSELKSAIIAYRAAFIKAGETAINGSGGLYRMKTFEEWLQRVTDKEVKAEVGKVTASTYFFMKDKNIIGSLQLRHYLNKDLEEHGGHIGYSILPNKRGQGYGRMQLDLGLYEARLRGMTEVLLTCDSSNIASRKTIESCGGSLLDENIYKGKCQVRYVIKFG